MAMALIADAMAAAQPVSKRLSGAAGDQGPRLNPTGGAVRLDFAQQPRRRQRSRT